MKLPRAWRPWVLAWVMIAFLGIQLIESTHHHESAALEDACTICQVAAQYPLDAAPPLASPLATVLFLLYILPVRRRTFAFVQPCLASFYSRAPPTRAA